MVSAGKQDDMTTPIRLGMVGGGQGAFIGGVHRMASRLDGHYQLVAGALSSNRERAKASAAELGLSPDRSYGSFEEMAKAESAREDGIEAVSIVTPNHMHFPAAKAFLEAGIHVICDKPMTSNLDDANTLAEIAEKSGCLFVLTHNYSGYPMIRQARQMVVDGVLGEITLIQAEYPQDWLTEPIEAEGQKQASWRTDPKQSGAGGAIGDIGTHAYQLGSFVSGLKAESVAADLDHFVDGRKLDDNAHVMLRYGERNGRRAKGMIWVSQVAPGNENGLKLRIYGTKGGLEWEQENPNYLHYTPFGEPTRILTRGGPGTGEAAASVTRIPPGHPEGYLEAFATLYTEAAGAIRAMRGGGSRPERLHLPDVSDGVDGLRFVEACVKSSQADAAWTRLDSL
ncbi:Gfo/Idh/MocA family protein [Nitratireductor basaltis]|uniref:Oxidoreductase-like protein n=1 Tax=Nitratireductor basaltis TaxID=472175 RepID=A0A084UD60_9HYPH|nr:Gfo/Idh/MocA family oxidoreductase [Nitratireductor basaltis]KFB10896.1 Oxidoreductase-like protein [Nitratireductor basaltis]